MPTYVFRGISVGFSEVEESVGQGPGNYAGFVTFGPEWEKFGSRGMRESALGER